MPFPLAAPQLPLNPGAQPRRNSMARKAQRHVFNHNTSEPFKMGLTDAFKAGALPKKVHDIAPSAPQC
eukprot:12473253-Alexandrium_andersonii.AAC.1